MIEETNIVYIYVLVEADTGDIRYVGESSQPNKRFYQHLVDADNNHRVHWIQSMLANGRHIEMKVIEVLTNPTKVECEEAEQFWIALFKEKGFKLTNGNDGGIGGWGYVHTVESKAKISAKLQGINAPSALLTEDKVVAIREKYSKGGVSSVSLGYEFGVHFTVIGKIVRGETWKHVGGPITRAGRGRRMETGSGADKLVREQKIDSIRNAI